MSEFFLQPDIYSTASTPDLVSALSRTWLDPSASGYAGGTYYLVSGFGTYNGGVRFYETFRHHVASGGRVRALLGGSRGQRLCSRQLANGLYDCGAEVSILNRRKILHAKMYGTSANGQQQLIVSSGNFTSPGLSLNLEATVHLDSSTVEAIGFDWEQLFLSILADPSILSYSFVGESQGDPVWELLYDESASFGTSTPEEGDLEDFVSLVLTLSHADTVRIQAPPGSRASLGSQYFWLPKDAYDFFPPLLTRNVRGVKATYSTIIHLDFISLNQVHEVRVTFEAENNLDFRMGTGPLRGTQLAREGDMAIVTRRGETEYELRIAARGTSEFQLLSGYANRYIGHGGKRYGYVPNTRVDVVFP